MQSTVVRPRYFWSITVLILLVGFFFRIWELGRASLWIDEMWTESWMSASFLDSLKLVLENGSQTPLYFILMYPFPHHNEFLLRLPSALLGTAGSAVMILAFVKLYGNYQFALVAGALVAVNPFHVWFSRTARPYPLVFLASVLVSYFFLLLLRGPRTRAKWVGFILASMVAYLTHYYSLMLPLAQYILFAFILAGRRKFFRQWIGAQVIAVIPLAVWVFAYAQQENIAFGIGWIPRPGIEDIPITLWNMTIGYDGSVSWYVVLGLIAAAAGLLPGVYYAIRERKTNRMNFYWFWLIVAPLAAGFAVSLFRPLYVDRYFTALMPAVLLLMIQGWRRLPYPGLRVALITVFILASISSILITLDHRTDEKEAWRSVAAYVEQEQQPEDGLLTETPIDLMVMLHYMNRDIDYAWLLDAPDLAEQYEEPIKRVWAVYRNPAEDGHRQGVLPDFDPFEPSISPMPEWLQERREQIILQKEFNGVTVLLLDTVDEFARVE